MAEPTLADIMRRLDELRALVALDSTSAEASDGPRGNRDLGDGDWDVKADDGREHSAVPEPELDDSTACSDGGLDQRLSLRAAGPFFEQPLAPGVVHVHIHVSHDGSSHSSVAGASEGTASPGSASADLGRSVAHAVSKAAKKARRS